MEVLRGKLKAFRLYDLLTLLNLSASTGTLVLRNAGHESSILFEKGALKFALTNEERFRLGSILLERGEITREQSVQVNEAMKSGHERFGEAAVRLGVCTPERVTDFLKIQVSEIIYACFLWDDGEFHVVDQVDWPGWAVTISVDIPNLIMEGARRIDEWKECVALLPDDSVVFRVVDNPEVQGKINLSVEEWKILFQIDGSRSLRILLDQTGLDPLELYRVIYGLLASKLVEPVTVDQITTVIQDRTVAGAEPDTTHRISKTGRAAGEPAPRDDTELVVSPRAISFHQLKDAGRLVGRLRFRGSESEVAPIELRNDEYLLGRAQTCHVVVADSTVSAVHARFVRTDEGYVIEDMNSQNGTFVNGARVTRQRLRHRDEIAAGRLRLNYSELYDVSEEKFLER